MDRELYASNPAGGKVFVTDVSDSESFRGRFWVEFAQAGNEHDAYTVEYLSTEEDAREVAGEVEALML